jgi:hypothetical protein
MSTAKGRFILLSFVVALLAGLPFTTGLPGNFILDDIPNIVNNDILKLEQLTVDALLKVANAQQISGNMRVLPTLSFALDYWRAGSMDPATFKITNIFIHALTAFALTWLFRSILFAARIPDGRARWLAPALALAWALHPLQVSSALYAVQRMQTMGTLLLVLALVAYLHARRAQIAGGSGRTGLLLALLAWVVSLGCKEDTVLLPAYTLTLELTVLRFAASDAVLSQRLHKGYLFASLIGAALYLFVAVPHYWSWTDYAARDFSTPERLLTQARVLCLYLWQIVVPMPSHMPFYYDWLQPSRGLLQPWTTLPAIMVVSALLASAWWLRIRQPLYALGVFLFFAGHFITSNVIGLELVFEHRNNFPLIGAVLAIGALLAQFSARLRLPPAIRVLLCGLLLAGLSYATLLRSLTWADKMVFARTSTELAPHSARAWFRLCMEYFEAGGGAIPGNPQLDKAIPACMQGAKNAPYALNSPATLLVLKTLRGDVTQQDWDLFQQRLNTVDMSWDNQRAPMILAYFARKGVALDKREMLEAFATVARRTTINAFNSASLGYFIMNDLEKPDQAMPYFVAALSAASPMDPFPQQLADELRAKGRPDLANRIQELARTRFAKPGTTAARIQ